MTKERLSAFSDGVIAVIITIMVLDLKAPHGADWSALGALAPVFLGYALSFVYVAIYWNNHHHLFALVDEVDGAVLWANQHVLFWISLIPFATSWLGEHPGASAPAALYGVSLLMPALAWMLLQRSIVRVQGGGSRVASALGQDWKGIVSPLLYLVGIALAFVWPLLSYLPYVVVAAMWLVPDRRFAREAAAPHAP